MKITLTQERLKELLSYDPVTGQFVWLVLTGKARPGNIAGQVRKDRYIQIGIGCSQFLAHRLAWLYVYGEWPGRCLDHFDLDRSNNRIANLRDVNFSVNGLNLDGCRSNNSSGYPGVSWHPGSQKWLAQIHVHGKKKHLGLFAKPEDAHRVYVTERTASIERQISQPTLEKTP